MRDREVPLSLARKVRPVGVKTADRDRTIQFSDLLRALRWKKQLSMRQAAFQCGVDPSYWSRLEQGDRPPPNRLAAAEMGRVICDSEAEFDLFMLRAGYAPESATNLEIMEAIVENGKPLERAILSLIRSWSERHNMMPDGGGKSTPKS